MSVDLQSWKFVRPFVTTIALMISVALFARDANAQNRPRGIATMQLMSIAFNDGGVIPSKYAQIGHDVSPSITWTGAPDSTRSFVLIVHDVDAAIGDGMEDVLHWMAWNIPGTAKSLAEGVEQGAQLASGMRQISISGPYYRGPAAPPSGPMHHYLFELYALDAAVNVAPTALSPVPTRRAVMDAMATHIRAKGVLVGLYRRPSP